jgi:hypothetical protein
MEAVSGLPAAPALPARVAIEATLRRIDFGPLSFLWTTWLTKVNISAWLERGGSSMATIERNSDDPVHDFAWHRWHRARRGGEFIDFVMLAGWVGLIGWVLMRH